MKATYEAMARLWGSLAESTYAEATSLKEDEEKVRSVYQRFKQEEQELFVKEGWTYDEFRAETLSRTLNGSISEDG